MSTPARQLFRFEATLEAVARTTAALGPLLPARLPEADRQAVELGLAEALTNIVVHGHAGRPPQPVELEWQETGRALRIEIRDTGRPIPAARLNRDGPSVFDFDATDLGRLPEGGMGLELIHGAFDRLEYASRDGVNRLRLVKFFP